MKTSIKNLLGAIALIAFVFLAQNGYSQINVNPIGNVGIGVNGSNSFKLYVSNNNSTYSGYFVNNNNVNSYKLGLRSSLSSNGTSGRFGFHNATYHNSAGTGSTYGIYNYSNNYGTGTGYGLYNYLNAGSSTGRRYGIYNYLYCGSNTGTKYALYSAVSCGGNYAGYFSGNVFISGTLTQVSDAAKKENIEPLESALSIVGQLDAKTYNYVQEEKLALPSEKQFGFLAQDLEKILPQLVKEVENPAAPIQSNEESAELQEEVGPQEYETMKSVNYIGLIPVLTKAIQEQQELIKAQSELLKKQQTAIEELKVQMSQR